MKCIDIGMFFAILFGLDHSRALFSNHNEYFDSKICVFSSTDFYNSEYETTNHDCASVYLMAITEFLRLSNFLDEDQGNLTTVVSIVDLLDLPLSELDKDKVEPILFNLNTVVQILSRSANCKTLTKNDFGTLGDPRSLNIGTLQTISYLIRLKARHLANSENFEECMNVLNVNLILGLNLLRLPDQHSIIVGQKIVDSVVDELEKFVELPGFPNLYWYLQRVKLPLSGTIELAQSQSAFFEEKYPLIEKWTYDSATEQELSLFRNQVKSDLEEFQVEPTKSVQMSSLAISNWHVDSRKSLLSLGYATTFVSKLEKQQVVIVAKNHSFNIMQDRIKFILRSGDVKLRTLNKASDDSLKAFASVDMATTGGLYCRLDTCPDYFELYIRSQKTSQRIAVLQAVETIRYSGKTEMRKSNENAAGKLPPVVDPLTSLPFTLQKIENGYRITSSNVDADRKSLVVTCILTFQDD